jgi:hypothetical protein
MLNARPIEQIGHCKHCGIPMRRLTTACARANTMACKPCKNKRNVGLRWSAVFFTRCKQCEAAIIARRSGREFCGDTCRCRYRAAMGYVSPSRRLAGPGGRRPKATVTPAQNANGS